MTPGPPGQRLVADTYTPEALAPALASIVVRESVAGPEPEASIVMLVVVYAFWSRKGFLKKWKREGKAPGLRADAAGLWAMVASSKRTAIAGLVIGIAAGLHMFVMNGLRHKFGIENAGQILVATGHDFGLTVRGTVYDPGYWYVTTQEAQWFGWLFNKLGWDNTHVAGHGLDDHGGNLAPMRGEGVPDGDQVVVGD